MPVPTQNLLLGPFFFKLTLHGRILWALCGPGTVAHCSSSRQAQHECIIGSRWLLVVRIAQADRFLPRVKSMQRYANWRKLVQPFLCFLLLLLQRTDAAWQKRLGGRTHSEFLILPTGHKLATDTTWRSSEWAVKIIMLLGGVTKQLYLGEMFFQWFLSTQALYFLAF